eukprot:g4750.t1
MGKQALGFRTDDWVITFWFKGRSGSNAVPDEAGKKSLRAEGKHEAVLFEYVDTLGKKLCDRYVRVTIKNSNEATNQGQVKVGYLDGVGTKGYSETPYVDVTDNWQQWHLVTLTRRKGDLKLYMDKAGTNMRSAKPVHSLAIGDKALDFGTQTSEIWIGGPFDTESCVPDKSLSKFDGFVNDIRLYHFPDTQLGQVGSKMEEVLASSEATWSRRDKYDMGRLSIKKTGCNGMKDLVLARTDYIIPRRKNSEFTSGSTIPFVVDLRVEVDEPWGSRIGTTRMKIGLDIDGKETLLSQGGSIHHPSPYCYKKYSNMDCIEDGAKLSSFVCGGLSAKEHMLKCIGKRRTIYTTEMCADECDHVNRSTSSKKKCTYFSVREFSNKDKMTHSCTVYLGDLNATKNSIGTATPTCQPGADTLAHPGIKSDLYEVLDDGLVQQCTHCPKGTFLDNQKKWCQACPFGTEATRSMAVGAAAVNQCGKMLPKTTKAIFIDAFSREDLLENQPITIGGSTHSDVADVGRFPGHISGIHIFDSVSMPHSDYLPIVRIGSGADQVTCLRPMLEPGPSTWLVRGLANMKDSPTYRSSRAGCIWIKETIDADSGATIPAHCGGLAVTVGVKCEDIFDERRCNNESPCLGPASNVLRDDECAWVAAPTAAGSPSSGEWFVLDFGRNYRLDAVRLTPYSMSGLPRKIEFQAAFNITNSDFNSGEAPGDGDWWKTRTDADAEMPEKSRRTKQFALQAGPESVARFWRLRVVSKWGQDSVSLRMLQMLGAPSDIAEDESVEVIRCELPKPARPIQAPAPKLQSVQIEVGPTHELSSISSDPSLLFSFTKRDCLPGMWSPWSPCSRPCYGSGRENSHKYFGGGTQWRTRRVVLSAENGGVCFEAPYQVENCAMDDSCPVDCTISDWSPWRPAIVRGGHESERIKEITRPNKHGGLPCSALGRRSEKMKCPTSAKICDGGTNTKSSLADVLKLWLRADATPNNCGGKSCFSAVGEQREIVYCSKGCEQYPKPLGTNVPKYWQAPTSAEAKPYNDVAIGLEYKMEVTDLQLFMYAYIDDKSNVSDNTIEARFRFLLTWKKDEGNYVLSLEESDSKKEPYVEVKSVTYIPPTTARNGDDLQMALYIQKMQFDQTKLKVNIIWDKGLQIDRFEMGSIPWNDTCDSNKNCTRFAVRYPNSNKTLFDKMSVRSIDKRTKEELASEGALPPAITDGVLIWKDMSGNGFDAFANSVNHFPRQRPSNHGLGFNYKGEQGMIIPDLDLKDSPYAVYALQRYTVSLSDIEAKSMVAMGRVLSSKDRDWVCGLNEGKSMWVAGVKGGNSSISIDAMPPGQLALHENEWAFDTCISRSSGEPTFLHDFVNTGAGKFGSSTSLLGPSVISLGSASFRQGPKPIKGPRAEMAELLVLDYKGKEDNINVDQVKIERMIRYIYPGTARAQPDPLQLKVIDHPALEGTEPVQAFRELVITGKYLDAENDRIVLIRDAFQCGSKDAFRAIPGNIKCEESVKNLSFDSVLGGRISSLSCKLDVLGLEARVCLCDSSLKKRSGYADDSFNCATAEIEDFNVDAGTTIFSGFAVRSKIVEDTLYIGAEAPAQCHPKHQTCLLLEEEPSALNCLEKDHCQFISAVASRCVSKCTENEDRASCQLADKSNNCEWKNNKCVESSNRTVCNRTFDADQCETSGCRFEKGADAKCVPHPDLHKCELVGKAFCRAKQETKMCEGKTQNQCNGVCSFDVQTRRCTPSEASAKCDTYAPDALVCNDAHDCELVAAKDKITKEDCSDAMGCDYVPESTVEKTIVTVKTSEPPLDDIPLKVAVTCEKPDGDACVCKESPPVSPSPLECSSENHCFLEKSKSEDEVDKCMSMEDVCANVLNSLPTDEKLTKSMCESAGSHCFYEEEEHKAPAQCVMSSQSKLCVDISEEKKCTPDVHCLWDAQNGCGPSVEALKCSMLVPTEEQCLGDDGKNHCDFIEEVFDDPARCLLACHAVQNPTKENCLTSNHCTFLPRVTIPAKCAPSLLSNDCEKNDAHTAETCTGTWHCAWKEVGTCVTGFHLGNETSRITTKEECPVGGIWKATGSGTCKRSNKASACSMKKANDASCTDSNHCRVIPEKQKSPAKCTAASQKCEEVGFQDVSTTCYESDTKGSKQICHIATARATLPFDFNSSRDTPEWTFDVISGEAPGKCTIEVVSRAPKGTRYENLDVTPINVTVQLPDRYKVVKNLPPGYIGYMRCKDSKSASSCSGVSCDPTGYDGYLEILNGLKDGDEFRLAGCVPFYRLVKENPFGFSGTMKCTDLHNEKTCSGIQCAQHFVGFPIVSKGARPGAVFQLSGCQVTFTEMTVLPPAYRGVMKCTDKTLASSCDGVSCNLPNYSGASPNCAGEECVTISDGKSPGSPFQVSGCVPAYSIPTYIKPEYSGNLECNTMIDSKSCNTRGHLYCSDGYRGYVIISNGSEPGGDFQISGCVKANELNESCTIFQRPEDSSRSLPRTIDSCNNKLRCLQDNKTAGRKCFIKPGEDCSGKLGDIERSSLCGPSGKCINDTCKILTKESCSAHKIHCEDGSTCDDNGRHTCQKYSTADSDSTITASISVALSADEKNALSANEKNELRKWLSDSIEKKYPNSEATIQEKSNFRFSSLNRESKFELELKLSTLAKSPLPTPETMTWSLQDVFGRTIDRVDDVSPALQEKFRGRRPNISNVSVDTLIKSKVDVPYQKKPRFFPGLGMRVDIIGKGLPSTARLMLMPSDSKNCDPNNELKNEDWTENGKISTIIPEVRDVGLLLRFPNVQFKKVSGSGKLCIKDLPSKLNHADYQSEPIEFEVVPLPTITKANNDQINDDTKIKIGVGVENTIRFEGQGLVQEFTKIQIISKDDNCAKKDVNILFDSSDGRVEKIGSGNDESVTFKGVKMDSVGTYTLCLATVQYGNNLFNFDELKKFELEVVDFSVTTEKWLGIQLDNPKTVLQIDGKNLSEDTAIVFSNFDSSCDDSPTMVSGITVHGKPSVEANGDTLSWNDVDLTGLQGCESAPGCKLRLCIDPTGSGYNFGAYKDISVTIAKSVSVNRQSPTTSRSGGEIEIKGTGLRNTMRIKIVKGNSHTCSKDIAESDDTNANIPSSLKFTEPIAESDGSKIVFRSDDLDHMKAGQYVICVFTDDTFENVVSTDTVSLGWNQALRRR